MVGHIPGTDEALGSLPYRAGRRAKRKKDSNVSPMNAINERMVLKSVIKSPEIGGSLPPALCYDVPGASVAPGLCHKSLGGCYMQMATLRACRLCTECLRGKSAVSCYLRKLRLGHLS